MGQKISKQKPEGAKLCVIHSGCPNMESSQVFKHVTKG